MATANTRNNGNSAADYSGEILNTAGNALLLTSNTLPDFPVNGLDAAVAVHNIGQIAVQNGQAMVANGMMGIPVAGAPATELASTIDNTLNGAVNLNVADASVTSPSATEPNSALGVGVLSPNTGPVGSVASVGILTEPQLLSVGLGAPTSGATTGASNGTADSPIGVQLASLPYIGTGASPLIGVNGVSGGSAQGTLVNVGLGGNGQPVSAAIGGQGVFNTTGPGGLSAAVTTAYTGTMAAVGGATAAPAALLSSTPVSTPSLGSIGGAPPISQVTTAVTSVAGNAAPTVTAALSGVGSAPSTPTAASVLTSSAKPLAPTVVATLGTVSTTTGALNGATGKTGLGR